MSSNIVRNTTTNYLSVAVRVLQAVLVTRWTVQYLGPDYYGLWALLWSFFSYAILLDFGFGVSAQKYTSAEVFKTDIGRYNRIISTVFSFHLAMLVIIAAGTITASFFLGDIIRVHDPEKLAYCRRALLIFGIGTAFIFPLGMFSEILVGLQKMYLRNYANMCAKIVELVGTLLIFLCGGRLISLVVFTMLTTLLTNIAIAVSASRAISGFRISFKLDWRTVKEISGFSGFTYLMSISRLVLNKSNRLLISIFCGLADVGAFHLASRLPEFCHMGASQYQENVRPISASLHAKGETQKLSGIIFNSMRWNMFIAVLIMLPCFLYSGEIIQTLFGVSSPDVTRMCRLFIVSMFIVIACRQIPEFYLQMADRHKVTAYVTMAEAATNLVLNIIMLPRFGVEIVLWNAIWIMLAYTFIIIVPCAIKSLGINPAALALKVYAVPLALCVPAVAVALAANRLTAPLGQFWVMSIGGAASAATFAGLAYAFMLDKTARERFVGIFISVFSKLKVVRKAK